MVLATHAAVWKQRGLLMGKQASLKHHKEILQLLEAINLSEKVTVIHWRGYQKDHSSISERNQKDDLEAKAMVLASAPNLVPVTFQ